MAKKLVPVKPMDLTPEILDESQQSLVAGIAGLMSTDRKDLFLSAGHVLQRIRGKTFFESMKEEWGRYVEKGKVKPDFTGSTLQFNTLHELLTALDTPQTDDVVLDLLKKIYMVCASDKETPTDSLLPQEYMRIAKKLSGTAILILFAAYQIYSKGGTITLGGSAEWLKQIVSESGLKYPALIENYEQELIDSRLLAGRDYPDRSGLRSKETFGLTDLGIAFCAYVSKYEGEEI